MIGTGDRTTLDIPGIDDFDGLDDFKPREAEPREVRLDPKKAIDDVSKFPSRETSPDAQLNLRGPKVILERFKALCKADRRPYYDMLEILMDSHERTKR